MARGLERGETPSILRDLLRIPLYDYQLRGALFARLPWPGDPRRRHGPRQDRSGPRRRRDPGSVRNLQSVLIVAPASVKYQWADRDSPAHVARRCRSSTAIRTSGTATMAGRRSIASSTTNRRRAISNGSMPSPPDLVVLDEAQRIKNWEAKTSREIKKLRSRYALVLTGTPLENKLEELYSDRAIRRRSPLRPGVSVPPRSSRSRTKGSLNGLSQSRSDPRSAGPDLLAADAGRRADAASRPDRHRPLSSSCGPSSANRYDEQQTGARAAPRQARFSPTWTANAFSVCLTNLRTDLRQHVSL